MSEVFSKITKAAKNLKSTVDAGNKETEGLGSELAARAQMQRAAAASLTPTPDNKPRVSPEPSNVDKVGTKPYGSRPGERRIDIGKLPDGTPVPKYHKGVDLVPKTGPAILKKGEAVIPAEKNPMNASDAMAGISGKKKTPPKKIKKITTHMSHDGKMIHTHIHHHPAHHEDETHISNNMDEMNAHMASAMPNMTAAAPSDNDGDEGGAPAPAPAGQ